MANYKLPWNYEPGANSINIVINFSTNTGNPILTNYKSKYGDYYLYKQSSDSIVYSHYTWSVTVTKANNPSVPVTLTEAEQLEVATTTGSYTKRYQIVYPNLSATFTDLPVYIAKPSSYYQIPKATDSTSSSFVDTSALANTWVSAAQMSKYWVPILTDINLNEEFKLRWVDYSTTISNLTYSLPSTYYVDNTIDNFSYDSSDSYNLNPEVSDSNSNVVNVLSRANDNWIMNIPSTGTYTLQAHYTRNSKTLKPTMGEDVKDITSNIDAFGWITTIEVYNPAVAKNHTWQTLVSANNNGYTQFYLTRDISSNHFWEAYNPTTEERLEFSDNYTLQLSSSETLEDIGLNKFSTRGLSSKRTMYLKIDSQSLAYRPVSYGWRYCFSTTDITGSTDSSLGSPLTNEYWTSNNVELNYVTVGNTLNNALETGLYVWNGSTWNKACKIQVTPAGELKIYNENYDAYWNNWQFRFRTDFCLRYY